jgi:protein-tyrosine phosphatase
MRIVLRPGRRPSFNVILPTLLVGEYPTPDDVDWLVETHGVTAVVNVQDHADLASKGLRLRQLEAAYERTGVQFHHVPIADGDTEGLRLRLDTLVELVRGLIAGGSCVYLHCNGGFNRAPTVAIAYLHVVEHMPLDDAVKFVKRCRPCVPFVTVLTAHYRSVEGRRSSGRRTR